MTKPTRISAGDGHDDLAADGRPDESLRLDHPVRDYMQGFEVSVMRCSSDRAGIRCRRPPVPEIHGEDPRPRRPGPVRVFCAVRPRVRGPGPGSSLGPGAPGHPRFSGRSPPEPPQRQRPARAVHLHREVFTEKKLDSKGAVKKTKIETYEVYPSAEAGKPLPPARRARRSAALGEGARRAGPQAGGEDGKARAPAGRRRTKPPARVAARKRKRSGEKSRRSSTRSSR